MSFDRTFAICADRWDGVRLSTETSPFHALSHGREATGSYRPQSRTNHFAAFRIKRCIIGWFSACGVCAGERYNFKSEEDRLNWVKSNDHQSAWPTIEGTFKVKVYTAILYDQM